MAAALLALFVVALVTAGAAFAYILGSAAVLTFAATDATRYLAIAPQVIFSKLDVFALMSLPLFVLAGEIMNRGGVTKALVDLSLALLGRRKGGLGHVNILAAMFLSGISGSGMADAAALSNTLVPTMRARGYSVEYAGAVTAAASVVGPIIPPSIILVFYGAVMSVDIGALFAAGIVPGVLFGLALMGLNTYFAHRYDHPGGAKDDAPPLGPTFVRALPGLTLPAVILSGIVFGVMTPTEAAAVAVAAAIAVGLFHRELDLRSFIDSCKRSMVLSGSIFSILAAVALIIYLAALTKFPQTIAGVVTSSSLSGTAYLVAMIVAFLVCGMFFDTMISLALVAPLLAPVAIAQGADPVHLGTIIGVSLSIGLITPPIGGSALVVSGVCGVSYWSLSRALLPFIAVEIAVLMLLIFVPELSLALPRVLGLL